MKMGHNKIRIGKLAEKLNVEKFVIRFWEKEFNINSTRSLGGQRFYHEKDIKTFNLIKDLLYNRGFTIMGAKKVINNAELIISNQPTFKAAAQASSSYSYKNNKDNKDNKDIIINQEANFNNKIIHNKIINNKITLLHQKLVKLRELL